MKLRGLLRFFILLLVFLSCKTSALAQNNSVDAAISGAIVDATGGAVGGVVVTATPEGQAGQAVASANSKADGTYSLAVPAGRYRVRFTRPPFGSLEEVVDVGAGESRVLACATYARAVVFQCSGHCGSGARFVGASYGAGVDYFAGGN